MKPLYRPRSLKLSKEDLRRACQVHWSVLQKEAESALGEALAIPPGVGVVLVDKCTHALFLSMLHQKERLPAGTTARISRETYRATVDAASMAGFKVQLTDGNSTASDALNVPVTLGGGCIRSNWLSDERVVVDAAHTGYRSMFCGILEWRALVCLSFFPTKPLGAFGGGAIIGPEQVVERIREQSQPMVRGRTSSFMYPQGIQSVAITRRLQDPQTWKDHLAWTQNAYELVEFLTSIGYVQRWQFVVPHILSFTHPLPSHVARLREMVTSLGYETGKHYEALDTPRANDVWVAIPFIYPELVGKLKKLYGIN